MTVPTRKEIEALRKMLRDWDDALDMEIRATIADALLALSRQVAELDAQIEDHLIVAHGLSERLDAAEAERDAAYAALQRIDGLNDNPACYNSDINRVIEGALPLPQRQG